jgi:hypothetical protein
MKYEQILEKIKENDNDIESTLNAFTSEEVIKIFMEHVSIDDYIYDFMYDQVVLEFKVHIEQNQQED